MIDINLFEKPTGDFEIKDGLKDSYLGIVGCLLHKRTGNYYFLYNDGTVEEMTTEELIANVREFEKELEEDKWDYIDEA